MLYFKRHCNCLNICAERPLIVILFLPWQTHLERVYRLCPQLIGMTDIPIICLPLSLPVFKGLESDSNARICMSIVLLGMVSMEAAFVLPLRLPGDGL